MAGRAKNSVSTHTTPLTAPFGLVSISIGMFCDLSPFMILRVWQKHGPPGPHLNARLIMGLKQLKL